VAAPETSIHRHPTESDFDQHARDLADLEVVRARKAWLPSDAAEREILDAREAHLRRRIRGWVEHFTGTDVDADHRSRTSAAGAARLGSTSDPIPWEGRSAR
jgi:hypothetical protein